MSETHNAVEPWPWPPLLQASLAVHALAGGAVIMIPGAGLWALGSVVLNHAVITVAGLVPRSNLLGANMTRLVLAARERQEIALTLDDGPDPSVTPHVLDILDAAGASATFFCIADRVVKCPVLAREMVERGHTIQNHTAAHRHHFSFLGPKALNAEIVAAQTAVFDVVGVAPQYFRAPAGLRNPFLAPVLHRLGLTFVSWTRRGFDTQQNDPKKVLLRLSDKLKAGDILLLHDGNSAKTVDGKAVVLHVLPQLLEKIRNAGLTPLALPETVAATLVADPC